MKGRDKTIDLTQVSTSKVLVLDDKCGKRRCLRWRDVVPDQSSVSGLITLAEFADIELEEGDFRVRIGSEVHCQIRNVPSRNFDEVFTNISDVNRFPTVGFNPISNPFTDKSPVVPSAVAVGTNDNDPVFVVVDLLGCDLSPGFVAVLVRVVDDRID